MTFSINKLVDHRVAVSGTDQFNVDGSTVLDSSEWDELHRVDVAKEAQDAFAAEVEAFFDPITQAAEAAKAAVEKASEVDEITYLVVQEETKGVAGKREVRRTLSHDSIVLRLLEEGEFTRLMWVDGGLEILESASTGRVAAQPSLADVALPQENLGPLT